MMAIGGDDDADDESEPPGAAAGALATDTVGESTVAPGYDAWSDAATAALNAGASRSVKSTLAEVWLDTTVYATVTAEDSSIRRRCWCRRDSAVTPVMATEHPGGRAASNAAEKVERNWVESVTPRTPCQRTQ